MLTSGSKHLHGLTLRRLAAVAAALAVSLASGAALAQSGKGDYVGRWSLAGNAGYAIPNTDEYANVPAWKFALGYSPALWFEVALEAGRFSTAVDQPEPDGLPNHSIASGRIEVVPVCVNLQFNLPLAASMTTAYLSAGGGYYLVDYTMDEAPSGVFAASGVAGLPDQIVRDAWGFHAGVGVEYALTAWLSVTAEGRYQFLAPQVSGTARDDYTLGGSLDLNTWLFTGGLKVAF